MQTRFADEVADRLAEAQHQRLLGRIDGEERVAGDDDRHDDGDQYPQAAERVPHFGAPAGFSGRRFERQVRHRRARAGCVEDRLAHAAEHALHRLEIHAFARHAGRKLVLGGDVVVALRLSLRVEDRLALVGFRVIEDARGRTLRLGDDFVGVGVGVVDRALLVLRRGGEVAIGRDDLRRHVDRLQLHLQHQHAGMIVVQHGLHPLLNVGLHRRAVGGEDAVDRLQADHFARDALGDRFDRLTRVEDVEDEVLGMGGVDLPDDAGVDVDDVLIAGQHLALGEDVAAAGLAAITDFGDLLVEHRNLDHCADRPRPVAVEAGRGLAGVAAEDEVEADLVGLDGVERAEREPRHQRDQRDDEDEPPGAAAACSAAPAAVGVRPRKPCCRRRSHSSRSLGGCGPVGPWPHGPCPGERQGPPP